MNWHDLPLSHRHQPDHLPANPKQPIDLEIGLLEQLRYPYQTTIHKRIGRIRLTAGVHCHHKRRIMASIEENCTQNYNRKSHDQALRYSATTTPCQCPALLAEPTAEYPMAG